MARQVLDARQIKLDKKALRRLCKALGKVGLEQRATVALEDEVSFVRAHGIYRHRWGSVGPARAQRAGGCVSPSGVESQRGRNTPIYTPWREPKLFTIYMLDEKGRVEKSFAPIHDATRGNADAMFEMLEATLSGTAPPTGRSGCVYRRWGKMDLAEGGASDLEVGGASKKGD